MKIWKRSIISVFLVVIIFSSIQVVSADPTALPTGGDGFDTAVTIEPGSYETDHEIARDTYEYFKITSVNAGQMLEIEFTVGDGEAAGASIYDSGRVELYSEEIYDSESAIVGWAPSSTGTFYIKIGTWLTDQAVGIPFDISVEDHYDANSTTDAGSTFDTALSVTAGDYDGFLAGDAGDDHEDYYAMSVGSGQLLDITLTPASDASYGLKIYDQNRVEKASTSSANAGAITSTSWTAPSAQDVYVVITRGWGTPSRTYSLSLSFGAAPGKATLTVTTTPVYGSVSVDGASWGTAPQTKSVDPGTYAISFGYVYGYTTPSSQSVTLAEGDSETVTGIYTAIGGDTDGNGGTGGGTPGFETLAVIAAIGVALIILRRRK